MFLPPNVISVYQPMDAGIILMVKRKYHYRLLTKYLEIFETRQMRCDQAVAAKMIRGTMGIEEGFPPHLRDAMDILCEIQEDVCAEKLYRCWKKSTLLDGYVNYPHPNTSATDATSTIQEAMEIDESPNGDHDDKVDSVDEMAERIKELAALVIDDRKKNTSFSNNEMEFFLTSL